MERFLGFIRESDDGDVCGGFIRAQLRDGLADIAAFGDEVGEDEHRPGFGGVGCEFGQVRNSLHAILEVLEAVDQLRAGHQIFVKNEREWRCHAQSLWRRKADCKINSRNRGVDTTKRREATAGDPSDRERPLARSVLPAIAS